MLRTRKAGLALAAASLVAFAAAFAVLLPGGDLAQAGGTSVIVGPGGNNSYNSATTTINPGETVTWTWDDVDHSVTADPNQSVSFNSGVQNEPFQFEFTFQNAGTYTYGCTRHGSMNGTVQVGPPPTPPATNTTVPTNTTAPTSTPTDTPAATSTSAATNTPNPTNTSVATNTPNPTNTSVATNTPNPTSTPNATNTPSATNTTGPSPTATNTPNPLTPTPTASNTPTATATSTTGPSPTATNTPNPLTPTPTATATSEPGTPTPSVTGTPPTPGATGTATPSATASGTPSGSPTATPTGGPPPVFDLFEGWTLPWDPPASGWPGPTLSDGQDDSARGEDEITAYFNENVDPNVWLALAIYDPEAELWGQHFSDPPLPAFQTLGTINPGDLLWIFCTTDATLTVVASP